MGLEQDRGALELSTIFDALSHPRRLVIVECLLQGEKSVGELVGCERLRPTTQVNVSQQLAILRSVGLVAQRRDGNHVIYRVVPSRLSKLLRAGEELLRERARARGA
jgi:DNA-binding transcriptional ArsR family regulator